MTTAPWTVLCTCGPAIVERVDGSLQHLPGCPQ